MVRLVLLSLLGLHAFAAQAAECLQGDAIYSDADKAYRITFSGSDNSQAGSASNRFVFETEKGRKLLDGWVSWSNGVSRPNGVLTYQCPDGDITGDELDACKIWSGVVYAVYPDGAVDLLPPDRYAAAHGLLLPDFGRMLRYSKPWTTEKLTIVPWDKFTYIGCGS